MLVNRQTGTCEEGPRLQGIPHRVGRGREQQRAGSAEACCKPHGAADGAAGGAGYERREERRRLYQKRALRGRGALQPDGLKRLQVLGGFQVYK